MKDGSAAIALPIHPPSLAVRAGDVLNVADTLRLTLELAELAIELADRGGHAPLVVARLRRMFREIKRGC